MQNQPVLYVRDGLNGPDRVLVDVNQLAADGTIALDWFQPSENGKYVAYGTSPSGSEMSTLHVIETKTGKIASRHDRAHAGGVDCVEARQLRLLLHALSEERRGAGRPGDVQPARFLSRAWERSRAEDPIFGEGRDPEDWPSVNLSNDGRWLLISVSQGWTKSELYLKDAEDRHAAHAHHDGQEFSVRRRSLQRQALHHDQRRCAAISRVRRRCGQL